MQTLPNEVLAKVLCRLPVKNLLRLRCVSRSWLALISNPLFVKLHLKRSAKTKINLNLFLSYEGLCRVDFDSVEDSGDLLQQMVIDYNPLRHQDYRTNIWGSCDGLLCISNVYNLSVFLLNPSTRKFIELPFIPVEVPNLPNLQTHCYYGFSSDNTNDDYKVVRLVVFRDDSGDAADYEVNVYSLRLNSWHKYEKFPNQYPTFDRIGNSIAGGAMHWVSRGEDDKCCIVAFDFRTGEYRVIPWPQYHGLIFIFTLSSLGGCLSLTCNYYSEEVEVWLLKEYGEGSEYWSKLITMELVTIQVVRPVAYSKSGGKVLLELDYETLVWYNLEQRSLEEDIRFHSTEDVIDAASCLESLVSVDVLRRL
ncbi:F-box protein CPR1-like [Impatiens glandulifera]|uniref:F-box protein CPR1-like n=1 Tax=Impatiens glandulifera TaxID=253017 RepID=UPI001FB13992|nr:F-box protein CPR1-like [Impatiens glandulifera]